jgi:hypothetical protein
MHSSFDPDGAGADLSEAIAVPGNGQLHQPGRAAGLPLGVLELENDDLEAAQVYKLAKRTADFDRRLAELPDDAFGWFSKQGWVDSAWEQVGFCLQDPSRGSRPTCDRPATGRSPTCLC